MSRFGSGGVEDGQIDVERRRLDDAAQPGGDIVGGAAGDWGAVGGCVYGLAVERCLVGFGAAADFPVDLHH